MTDNHKTSTLKPQQCHSSAAPTASPQTGEFYTPHSVIKLMAQLAAESANKSAPAQGESL